MNFSDDIYKNYFAHFGILGMRWGKRNGPPYPLDPEDHSAREKRLGWRKSLNRGKYEPKTETKRKNVSSKKENEGLKYKTAIKVGVAAIAAGLAVYGAYKLGAFDKLKSMAGKKSIDDAINAADKIRANASNKTADDLQDLLNKINSSKDGQDSVVNNIVGMAPIKRPGFETEFQSLHKANPHKGTHNCAGCSVAGILRTMGYRVSAKVFDGATFNDVIAKGFKNFSYDDPKVYKEFTIGKLFAQSPESAKECIKKAFGSAGGTAKGVCTIRWKGRGAQEAGHMFSWIMENGVVRFSDFQKEAGDSFVSRYWSHIDPGQMVQIARLDELVPDWSQLSKFIDLVAK